MEELNIGFIIDLFKRNLLAFLKFTVSTGFILLLFLAFSEPKYSVNTSLIIEEKDESMNVSPETMLLGGQSQKIANEIEIIKSRKVIDNVITKLNMQYVVEKKYNFLFGYYLNMILGKRTLQGSLNIIQLPEKMRGKDFNITVSGLEYEVISDSNKSTCEFDKTCAFLDGNLHISKLGEIDTNIHFVVKYKPFIKIRDDFSSSLEITPLGDSKSSNIFEVKITSPDPNKTRLILEFVNQEYISAKVLWKSNDADEQQKFLQKMLLDIKKDLNQKSNELAIYQKDNQTVMPDLQFTEIMKRNVEIEKDIAILKLQEEIVNKYNDSINIDELSPVPAPVIIDDLSVQMTVKAHNELISKQISLSANLTENHPLVVKLKADIRQARIGLKELLKKTSANYVKSGELLKKQSVLIFSTIENLPRNLMNIAALQRDVFITEKLYAFLAQKFYEAGINTEMNMSTIRILDDPTANVKKISPKLPISLLIILMLSFFASFSYVIIMEFFRKNVISANEIVSILKIPYAIINTKISDKILKSILDIGGLNFSKPVRKIAVYSLIPEVNILSDVSSGFFTKTSLINIIKTSSKEIETAKIIDDTISFSTKESNIFSSGGLNQYLINKKINELFSVAPDRTCIVFSQIEKEVIDKSFFELFDLFIILASSKSSKIQKLIDIKTAIDNSGCETIAAVIIDE